MLIPMALHIRHPEADRLARRLAKATGKPLTEVVIEALRDRLRREERRTAFPRLKEEIMAISRRAAALPRRTGRSADEIIGYDERGLPR
jgi:antitoxin VapB